MWKRADLKELDVNFVEERLKILIGYIVIMMLVFIIISGVLKNLLIICEVY